MVTLGDELSETSLFHVNLYNNAKSWSIKYAERYISFLKRPP